MTTINNFESLIEQVGGIEKARGIVEGASFGTHYQVDTGKVICCHNENHFYFVDQVKLGVEFIRLDDLRTAIAQYDSREFKAGDWVEPIASGSSFKAMQLTAVCESHMEAGKIELNYGHWKKVDSNTDHVTDIRNHISSNTTVIDLDAKEELLEGMGNE